MSLEQETVGDRGELGPDEAWCRKCGARVRYGNVPRGKGVIGVALDADKVPHGPYRLVEEVGEDGVLTGRWLAIYIKAAHRKKALRYRSHSCHPADVAKYAGEGT